MRTLALVFAAIIVAGCASTHDPLAFRSEQEHGNVWYTKTNDNQTVSTVYFVNGEVVVVDVSRTILSPSQYYFPRGRPLASVYARTRSGKETRWLCSSPKFDNCVPIISWVKQIRRD